jgi:hypothetical protein
MTRLQKLYNASVGKTGMPARVFVSLGLVTLLLMTMLVACGDSDTPTATATATLVNATSTPAAALPPMASSAPSTAPSTAPSASPLLPIANGSARPSNGPAASAAPSAPASSSTSTGAVAAASDGSCPTDHPIKAGQLGPLKSYTVSGSTSYDTMRATECFATEADAQTAGYRKSAR